MSRSTARDLVRAVGVRAGVSDRMSPHSLRHGYANGAEAVGVPRTQIQADLGHLSSTTTDLYLHAGKRHEDFGGHQLAAAIAKKSRKRKAA